MFVNGETTINFGTSIATVFLSFMALEIPVEPNRVPGRALVLTVCISGALVFWSYNAGLVSLLTVDNIQFPVKSMKDLAEKSQYNLIIQKGTAYEDYFKNAKPGSYGYCSTGYSPPRETYLVTQVKRSFLYNQKVLVFH